MPQVVSLDLFLKQSETLIDVRSPSEFKQGHIPHSYSIPLFSNEERALIGTLYKKEGHSRAIDLGLQIAGPKLYTWVNSARDCFKSSDAVQGITCWRGGMRSGFVARLLESIGIKTWTLQGGYQTYRRWTQDIISSIPQQFPKLLVLGGLTGSRKTIILQNLKSLNEQVLDLENLAHHCGSVFGHLGMAKQGDQPSQEQFENDLAYQWNQFDLSQPIWIEDESRLIGKCYIPTPLYNSMKQSPVFYLECSEHQRLTHLLHFYGQASSEELIQATQQIKKRLGGQLFQEIIHLFFQNEKRAAFKKLLMYYDKSYQFQLTKRSPFEIHHIPFSSDIDCAYYLKEKSKQVFYDSKK